MDQNPVDPRMQEWTVALMHTLVGQIHLAMGSANTDLPDVMRTTFQTHGKNVELRVAFSEHSFTSEEEIHAKTDP